MPIESPANPLIKEIVLHDGSLRPGRLAALSSARPRQVSRAVLERIAESKTPQHLLAIVRRRDIPIAEILRKEGYVCGLVSDTYHYRAPGMNYHRGFNAYRWIRGQEYDPYNSAPPRRYGSRLRTRWK